MTARAGGARRSGVRSAAVAAALCWGAARLPFVEDEVGGQPPLVRPGTVCVDIGADYGLHSWVPADLTGPAGHVHSVEPLPGPARWLRTTGRLLGGSARVTVHRTALGARPGRGVLSLPRRGVAGAPRRLRLTDPRPAGRPLDRGRPDHPGTPQLPVHQCPPHPRHTAGHDGGPAA